MENVVYVWYVEEMKVGEVNRWSDSILSLLLQHHKGKGLRGGGSNVTERAVRLDPWCF